MNKAYLPKADDDSHLSVESWPRSISKSSYSKDIDADPIRSQMLPMVVGLLMSMMCVSMVLIAVHIARREISEVLTHWKAIQHWPSEPAIIVSSQVREYSADQNADEKRYYPNVVFSYSDPSRPSHFLRGTQVSEFDIGTVDHRECEAFVARYPPGSTRTCYFRPTGRHDAVLDPTVPPPFVILLQVMFWEVVVLASVVTAVCVLVLITIQSLLWNRKKEHYPFRLHGVRSNGYFSMFGICGVIIVAIIFCTMAIAAAFAGSNRIQSTAINQSIYVFGVAGQFLLVGLGIYRVVCRKRMMPSIELIGQATPGGQLRCQIHFPRSAMAVEQVRVQVQHFETGVLVIDRKLKRLFTPLMDAITFMKLERPAASSVCGSWDIPIKSRGTIIMDRYRITWQFEVRLTTKRGNNISYYFPFPMNDAIK